MSDLLRYSVQPRGELLVETPVGVGWQTIVDGATGAPMDLRDDMIAAGGVDGAQVVWDRLFNACRYFRNGKMRGEDA